MHFNKLIASWRGPDTKIITDMDIARNIINGGFKIHAGALLHLDIKSDILAKIAVVLSNIAFLIKVFCATMPSLGRSISTMISTVTSPFCPALRIYLLEFEKKIFFL